MFHLLTFVHSSRGDHWILASVGAIIGAAVFRRGFRLLRRKRLILNTPTSRIRSASMGLVEVSGQATGPYTLTAPITGHTCYYYRTIVWQRKKSNDDQNWDVVADEGISVPFYLDDNTGRLLVDPQGAETDIHRDFHEQFDLSMPQGVADFLVQRSIDTTKPVRVDEYCIKPQNALFVMGTLAENPGLKVTPTPARLLTTPVFKAGLSISGGRSFAVLDVRGSSKVTTFTRSTSGFAPTLADRQNSSFSPAQQDKIGAALKKAGITNPEAWAAVGLTYPGGTTGLVSAAAAAPALDTAFDLNPKTVLMKGRNNPAFFISWRSQRQVVASLGWKSVLMIWGGPALTLACSYVLLAHFGWL